MAKPFANSGDRAAEPAVSAGRVPDTDADADANTNANTNANANAASWRYSNVFRIGRLQRHTGA